MFNYALKKLKDSDKSLTYYYFAFKQVYLFSEIILINKYVLEINVSFLNTGFK